MRAQKVNTRKLLYVFTTGPYSSSNGQEGIDAVLTAAAFEQDVSVLFIHDGVFQIKGQQNSSNSELKQFTKTFRALDDFDINKFYVFDISLASRGLSIEQLSRPVEVLDSTAVAQLIKQQDKVFTF